MRTPEFGGSLVIFINGKSIGIVATDIPEEVFGFVELHGDCDNIIMTPDHRVEEVRRRGYEVLTLTTENGLHRSKSCTMSYSCVHVSL